MLHVIRQIIKCIIYSGRNNAYDFLSNNINNCYNLVWTNRTAILDQWMQDMKAYQCQITTEDDGYTSWFSVPFSGIFPYNRHSAQRKILITKKPSFNHIIANPHVRNWIMQFKTSILLCISFKRILFCVKILSLTRFLITVQAEHINSRSNVSVTPHQHLTII